MTEELSKGHILVELFLDVSHPFEVGHGGSSVHGSILNFVLVAQVVQGFDGGVQSRHCEGEKQCMLR